MFPLLIEIVYFFFNTLTANKIHTNEEKKQHRININEYNIIGIQKPIITFAGKQDILYAVYFIARFANK